MPVQQETMAGMDLSHLLTEASNPRSQQIDTLPTEDLLHIINSEDAGVAAAVAAEIPAIARAVDEIARRIGRGGCLFYIGAGTSGRLGVLDASECPPTFGVPRDLVQGIIAGGDPALRVSAEGAEDSAEQGAQDLLQRGFNQSAGLDTLVGIAASGRTPYVLGAMALARDLGCLSIGLSCVPGSPLASAGDLAITPATGPEVITGSTRMKAGTATKLVLNMLSTGLMIRLGHVYGNRMTNVQPTNQKLVDRASRLIAEIAEMDLQPARDLLQQAGSVKAAIVMHRLRLTRMEAEQRLAVHGGDLRRTLEEANSTGQ